MSLEDSTTELEAEQKTKLIYLEIVLEKILELNSIGKTLKLHQIAQEALDKIKQ
jgi:hypothetical protein